MNADECIEIALQRFTETIKDICMDSMDGRKLYADSLAILPKINLVTEVGSQIDVMEFIETVYLPNEEPKGLIAS